MLDRTCGPRSAVRSGRTFVREARIFWPSAQPDLHANGSDVLPVLWSDNYFTLFAGESQLVTANYSLASAGQLPLTFAASSWNQVMSKKAKTDDRLVDDPTNATLRPLDLRQFAVSPVFTR